MTASRIPQRHLLTVILVAGLLLFAVLWLAFPHSFTASDPWAYSVNAFNFSKKLEFAQEDITFSYRIGVYLPVAAFYKLFGINILATHAWPLCAAILTILLVWCALPDEESKIAGLLLCLTSVPLFAGSVDLYPDLIAAAFMGWSVLVLAFRDRHVENVLAGALWALFGVFCAFVAFLAKESAYWLIPVWILVFVIDAKSERFKLLCTRFYVPTLVSALITGIGYLVFSTIIWGDPLIRLKNLQGLTDEHLWSWNSTSAADLIRRLSIDPVIMLYSEYGLVVVLAALSCFILPPQLAIWGYYCVSCVALFWFGSTSFTRYKPLPLYPRYMLPALPGFYILAGYLASRLRVASDRGRFVGRAIPLALILTIAAIQFWTKLHSWWQTDLPEPVAVRIVMNDVLSHPEKKYLLITSDSRSLDSLAFYFAYEYPRNLQVVSAANLGTDQLKKDKYFVFVDANRSKFLKKHYDQPSYDNDIRSIDFKQVYGSRDIALYMTESTQQVAELLARVKESNRRGSS